VVGNKSGHISENRIFSDFSLLVVGFLPDLLSESEDGGDNFLRNVRGIPSNCTELNPDLQFQLIAYNSSFLVLVLA
jgi:hypothetical protein